MSHEAHHDTHHHVEDPKPTTSFRSAFWFVLILAGLFVAAVNFVDVMGHDEEGHGGGHATEHATGTGHGDEHATPGAHSNEQNATDVQKHNAEATPSAHTGKDESKDAAHTEGHH